VDSKLSGKSCSSNRGKDTSKALAISSSTRSEGLLLPFRTSDKKEGETPDRVAKSLFVIPRLFSNQTMFVAKMQLYKTLPSYSISRILAAKKLTSRK
jgi:hypothetical protein